MTPEQIVGALRGRGWQAEIVSQSSVDDLVPVDPTGLMKCVDGRLSDHAGMRGPKTLGGVYAIATARGVRDTAGVQKIVREVAEAGYVPSVHGDDGHGPMGCGFFKLWVTGELTGLEAPEFDAEAGKTAVLEADGKYETLKGNHAEQHVLINLVPKTTFEPKQDQRFVVDAWICGEFDLDVPAYLVRAAETVEKLGGKQIAKIIVPA